MALGKLLLAALGLALGAPAPARAAGQVVFVDPTGAGGAFTTIDAAILAAGDGDVVLIRAGDYVSVNSPVIDGKSLTLAVDPPGAVATVLQLIVRNVPAGKSVAVRGLRIDGIAFAVPTLAVENCAGHVAFEDVTSRGASAFGLFGSATPARPALEVTNSQSVSAVRCSFTGGNGIDFCNCGSASTPSRPGAPGVASSASTLALLDCAATGGKGGKTSAVPAAYEPGGAGVSMAGGTGWLSGTIAAGGAFVADGLEITAPPTAPVLLQDVTFASGAQGGLPLDAPPGSTSAVPAAARHFSIASPVREFQPAALAVAGQPNDTVLLAVGLQGGVFPVGGLSGRLLLQPSLQGPFFLAVLPAPSGALNVAIPAPALVSPALQGFASWIQALFLELGGAAVAGPVSVFALIDAGL